MLSVFPGVFEFDTEFSHSLCLSRTNARLGRVLNNNQVSPNRGRNVEILNVCFANKTFVLLSERFTSLFNVRHSPATSSNVNASGIAFQNWRDVRKGEHFIIEAFTIARKPLCELCKSPKNIDIWQSKSIENNNLETKWYRLLITHLKGSPSVFY